MLILFLATGRNHTDVASILGKIGAEHAVMITSNGARVRDLKGNLIYSNSLLEEIVLELYKIPFDRTKIVSILIKMMVGLSIQMYLN